LQQKVNAPAVLNGRACDSMCY